MVKEEKRLTWDEVFMKEAIIWAEQSRCVGYKVGAVIARDKQPLSVGYNGPVRGDVHCTEVGCAKIKDGIRLPPGSGCCRGAHGEMNAISNAANIGVPIKGGTLYITMRPCFDCSKHVINAGITRVVYLEEYFEEPAAIALMKKVGVDLVKFDTISDLKFNFKSKRG